MIKTSPLEVDSNAGVEGEAFFMCQRNDAVVKLSGLACKVVDGMRIN